MKPFLIAIPGSSVFKKSNRFHNPLSLHNHQNILQYEDGFYKAKYQQITKNIYEYHNTEEYSIHSNEQSSLSIIFLGIF